jgi:nitrogenase molybdenum-iron protein beta chain
MAQLLDQPRYKCALGAMQTVQAIPGAIPILHSSSGCGAKLNDNGGVSGHYSYHVYPCSAIGESEVVFGGEPKLRDVIGNALRILDAQLYVVMTGCTSEIIGDDVAEVVSEFAGADQTVVYANTPGFKGSNYEGHDWVLQAIFEQYLNPNEKPATQKGLVNIFAAPPIQDPFWLGNLRVLEGLIQELGLTPNTIFGHGRGLPNVEKLPSAEFNVLVSPWVGLESVRYLSDTYDIPLLHYPILPIGAFETSKFLHAVAEFAGVDQQLVKRVVEQHESEYYYYIERYADLFLELRIMSKRFVVVSDSQYALAITKFLVNDLGMFPTRQFVTDNIPAEHQSTLAAEFKNLNYGIEAPFEVSTNGFDIHNQIREADFAGPPLILGSSFEKRLADTMGGHYVNVSYPVIERIIINSAVAGYGGGLKLLEDIYTAGLSRLIL